MSPLAQDRLGLEGVAYSDLFDSVRSDNIVRRAQVHGLEPRGLRRAYAHLAASEIMRAVVLGRPLVLPENAVYDSPHFFALAGGSTEVHHAFLRLFQEGRLRVSCRRSLLRESLGQAFESAIGRGHGEFVLSGWHELPSQEDPARVLEVIQGRRDVDTLAAPSAVAKLETIFRLDEAIAEGDFGFQRTGVISSTLSKQVRSRLAGLRRFDPNSSEGRRISAPRVAAATTMLGSLLDAVGPTGLSNQRSAYYRFLSTVAGVAAGEPLEPPPVLDPADREGWSNAIRACVAGVDAPGLMLALEDVRDLVDLSYNQVVSDDHGASRRTLSTSRLGVELDSGGVERMKLGVAGVRRLLPRSFTRHFVDDGEGLNWAAFHGMVDGLEGATEEERVQRFVRRASRHVGLMVVDRTPLLSLLVKLGGEAYGLLEGLARAQEGGPFDEAIESCVSEYAELEASMRILSGVAIAQPSEAGEALTREQLVKRLAPGLQPGLREELLWNPAGPTAQGRRT